jgi:hypothetical protein
LVVIETLLLVLLAFVMVGLLRSHAEILRRLPDAGATATDGRDVEPQTITLEDGPGVVPSSSSGPPTGSTPSIPAHLPGPRGSVTPAHDVMGRTLDGASAVIPVETAGAPTLVAFLSSGCLTCRTFWEGLRAGAHEPMPDETRVVVITKDPQFESPSRLRDLAPDDVPVLQSSQAWSDYGISMSPYFVMVGADGEVRSEGAASSWPQVRSLLTDAIADEAIARGQDPHRTRAEGATS